MPENVSALHLVLTGDPGLFAIVRLSLVVSLSAVLFAALIGVPLGALIALIRFPGREAVIVVLNALMGLPPVVVGLAVFLALSRSGPLGSWGLLFTPQAMIIAQTILVAPIIAALTRQTIEDLWIEYQDEFAAMNEAPNVHVHGTARNAHRVLAFEAAGRFQQGPLLVKSPGHLFKIVGSNIRRLLNGCLARNFHPLGWFQGIDRTHAATSLAQVQPAWCS